MNPKLRGQPVAVVPLLADTTCCIAVSYEGKAFGVKTGTQVSEAKKICPKMNFIVGNHQNYIQYHHRIVETVESCLPVESVCSIDEIACRLTGSQQTVSVAEALAMKIKAEIRNQVGSSLCCSIGVAPNRYLAKIAADMKKPDGFTVLRPCDLPDSLYPLSLRDLPGIGAQMEARLNDKKIFSIQKLCSLSVKELRQAWGSILGEQMWHLLRGEEVLQKSTEQKSINHSHVLPPELRHEPGALLVLKKLTSKAAIRLRKDQFFASGIQIFVKFSGQDPSSRGRPRPEGAKCGPPAEKEQGSKPRPDILSPRTSVQGLWKARCGLGETQDTLAFIHAVLQMWKELPAGSIYAVGVALTGLVPEAIHAPSLFEDHRRNHLTEALDKVNEKFGKDAVHFGATHETKEIAPLRIAFTRIPDIDEV